ncbi:MAG: pantoate--beta-alanine ligase [Chloroflexi bacterium]|nr:pantoate--beta-alanine ligase [Chloroflexota bacterium]
MQRIRSVAELREWRGPAGDVGFVPTMGALHDGHLALVERAVRDNEGAIASIFVNPAQFGPNEDYRAYPRDEERDLALLERAGCHSVFLPSVAEMYPPGDDMRVVPGDIASRLEGAARPGHFAGVCTIVAKLFGMVRPTRAYFGQKDFQQLRVLQTMVRSLALDVRVVPCPIVRAADGLALSSRNAYLGADERARALALSGGLLAAAKAWVQGERDATALRRTVEAVAHQAGSLEYVSVADPVTLREVAGRAERAVISLACRVGNARLLDNVLLGMTLDELAEL